MQTLGLLAVESITVTQFIITPWHGLQVTTEIYFDLIAKIVA
jgi:hypothetical protein